LVLVSRQLAFPKLTTCQSVSACKSVSQAKTLLNPGEVNSQSPVKAYNLRNVIKTHPQVFESSCSQTNQQTSSSTTFD